MNATARRITATIAIPAATLGIALGGLSLGGLPAAAAQPMDGQCASMTMTNGQGGANQSALTRAGQVGAASAPGASDGSMAVDCTPASHG